MVYLVKDNSKIRVFYSETEMKTAGYKKADLSVTEEQYNSTGCYTRIIEGKIVVGKTAGEIKRDELQDHLSEIDEKLADLDRKFLTPRVLRGIGLGDKFSISKSEEHEAAAAPLRAEREPLKIELEALISA